MRKLFLVLSTALVPAALPAQGLALENFTLLDGDGTLTPGITILVEDGRIARRGAQPALSEGVRRVAGEGLHLTPALVDAGTALGLGSPNLCEEVREVTPHITPLAGLDPWDGRFREVLAGGVGTVALLPGTANVIAGTSAVLRLTGPGGRPEVAVERGALVATLGLDPTRGNTRFAGSYYFRRPNSRMGTNWVFRQAFHRARREGKGENPGRELLRLALEGELPLRITARPEFDITTAIRLAGEFGLRIRAIDEAPEAYRQAKLLAERKIPVVLAPMSRPMTRDQADYEIDYIARLARAGVPLAIQTGRGLSRHHLIEEARLALRFGLTPRDAIRAVTLVPARILGLADRLGTLAPGKEADLVIWNGHPLSQTSRPLCVILAGQVKHGALPRQEGSL